MQALTNSICFGGKLQTVQVINSAREDESRYCLLPSPVVKRTELQEWRSIWEEAAVGSG